MKWWIKAMETAKRLGAKLEEAYTLQEIASRLEEPGTRYHEFQGKKPEILRTEAETILKECKLI